MERKLNVKLIHCGNRNLTNPEDHAQKNIFFMPVGLPAIAHALEENGHDVEILHSDLLGTTDVRNEIDFDRLDVVGFDCHWVNQSLAVMETAKYLKEIKPSVFIFAGGFTASFFSKEIIEEYPQIDAVVRGDGEVPVTELCTSLAKGGADLSQVRNLVWRDPAGKTVETGFTYTGAGKEMACLDFGRVELLRNWQLYRDLSRYWTNFTALADSPLFMLSVGRGCTYACSFCGGSCEAQKQINNRRDVTVRDVDSVMETIKQALGYGYTCFYTGYEFPGSDAWYIRLFEKIRGENLEIDFIYGSYSLPSKALLDALEKSVRYGMVEISPETGQEALRRRNKDTRLYYSNAVLEDCLEYIGGKKNIKAQLYFGYFLPFDSYDSVTATMDYILELLLKYSRFVEIEYSNFSTDPGSLVYLYPEKYDVDLAVGSLKDYMAFIDRMYISGKEKQADMKLFSPRGLDGAVRKELEAKVSFINFIFTCFRSSVSRILQGARESGWIREMVDRYEEAVENEHFSPRRTMELILAVLEKKGAFDMEIAEIMLEELEKNKLMRTLTHTGPGLYMDSPADSLGTGAFRGNRPCNDEELVFEFDL